MPPYAGLDKFVLEEFKSLDSVKAVYGVYIASMT